MTNMQEVFRALPDDPAAIEADKKFIRRTYEIAKSAVVKGNHPFGALLVFNEKIIAEIENSVVTSKDVTKHAETGLVSFATQKFDKDTLSRSILYTSTEPCIMCCGAIHYSGITKIVYGTTSSQMVKLLDGEYRGIPSKEVFARINPKVKVVGPVLEDIGLKIHKDFWPKFYQTIQAKKTNLSE